MQLVVRQKETKLGIDFIHSLETGEFQNLLQSGFDFKQFKVISNYKEEVFTIHDTY